jgi:hypothetical protein
VKVKVIGLPLNVKVSECAHVRLQRAYRGLLCQTESVAYSPAIASGSVYVFSTVATAHTTTNISQILNSFSVYNTHNVFKMKHYHKLYRQRIDLFVPLKNAPKIIDVEVRVNVLFTIKRNKRNLHVNTTSSIFQLSNSFH